MEIKKQIENFIPYNEQESSDKDVILKAIDCFDDVLTRENEICHFTASCWITNRDCSKILMIYHNIYDSWSWAGGHADGESDLSKTALKEASEETGLGMDSLKLITDEIFALQVLPVTSHFKKGRFVSSHLHLDCCFLMEADENADLKIKEDENSGVKWVDIDRVVELSNEEHMKPIYSKLNAKLTGGKL